MTTRIDGITIGSIEISQEAGASFAQSYSNRRVTSRHVMGDGSLKQQTLASTASKLTTRITGTGWMPIGLSSIDTTVPQVVKCAAPLAITSASNIITIPAERRSDSGYEPRGFAIVDGFSVDTTISMNVNEATLGVVSGATAYRVQWIPQITAFVNIDAQDLRSDAAEYSFTITATEQ